LEEFDTRPRRVLVLGHDASFDVRPMARRVLAEHAELLLLTLGHPVAPAQAATVRDALRLAGELRLWLDIELVLTPGQVAELLRDDDQITVLAGVKERKKIERALGERIAKPSQNADTPYDAPRGSGAGHRGRPRSIREKVHSAAGPANGGVGAIEMITPDNGFMADQAEGAPQASASESVEALAGRQVAKPTKDTVWTMEDAQARKAAPLRIYLGMAPGVGKTFAMLGEGQRRKARGTDVVVGVIHTYDRPRTIEMLEGLEIVPARRLEYEGATFEEMDAEALIERRPEVALIDELAHTNIPGSRRAKRWEDVLDVLAEGITVITTLNVQHLASLNDVVARITGIRQQETVPDWILDIADDVEVVDMSPNALQRRMIHGNVYPDPRKAELALRRFFTKENLTALRELALMKVANQVDEDLLKRWSKDDAPETRERILVCVSRSDMAEALVRRGARMAHRARGDLFVLYVRSGDPIGAREDWTRDIERLTNDLGGQFQILDEDDPVEGTLSYAYRQSITQIVVGESLRSRWQELLRGSFVNSLIQRASNIDVHVIARKER
jgi:nucleotide-binding universal stress UspA family protein